MSKPGRISIKTIISNVIRDLQLQDVSHIVDSMIEWAYEAETKIASYDTFVRRECEVTIKNNRVRLPGDFYQFISFKIGNNYPEITNRDFRMFYKDSPNLATNNPAKHTLDIIGTSSAFGIDGTEISGYKMRIEKGWIHISGFKDMENKAGLAYMALDLDEDGYPYVKDGHETAVTAYIIWKLQTPDYVKGKTAHHVYKELENRWYWLCGQARGDDEMPDPKQLEYIANMYHQLLPMPSKNFF